ncbi:MAG TPA: GMC family oxidoreductase, partial [Mycobacteriales bacterium]|nr:GMC family oxidoreductase [Mycobacteriales bacterium]
RALATGNCHLALRTRAERLVTDSSGRVTGVALIDGDLGRRTVQAEQVIVAAGAIETARLLLGSRSDREPDGIGNNHDQVGRNLQGHVYSGAVGIFADVVQTAIGPGPTISTNDFRHGNPGLIGGGMLANDFVTSPINSYGMLTRLGLAARWGSQGKTDMRHAYSRASQVMGPLQESPNPESRVTLSDQVTDSLGIPAVRLSGRVLDCDRPTSEFMADRAAEWLRASGAVRVVRMAGIGSGPSGGQHQAGTCRMGADPRTSVVDPQGRVWGHSNLRLADGSVHVTNGGVNPVLTIMANAYRIADLMLRDG